jgi:hypothetical protein
MLCKIRSFHRDDYEECPPLVYKILVLTSQETHHVSATGFSLLMRYKIEGFHGSDYENVVFSDIELQFVP